jgi:SNF2 family DNA or RNA helicase
MDKQKGGRFKDSLKLAEKLREMQTKYSVTSFQDRINLSNKIRVLFELLAEFKRKGNKVLIFSKTKIFLDVFERFLLESC